MAVDVLVEELLDLVSLAHRLRVERVEHELTAAQHEPLTSVIDARDWWLLEWLVLGLP